MKWCISANVKFFDEVSSVSECTDIGIGIGSDVELSLHTHAHTYSCVIRVSVTSLKVEATTTSEIIPLGNFGTIISPKLM